MIKIEKYNKKYLEKFTKLFNQWDASKSFTDCELLEGIEDTIHIAKNEVIIAVDENEEVVGYALYGKCYHIGFKPFVEIMQIIVDERKRNSGIGAKLVDYIEKYAINEEIKIVKLSSQIYRERAHHFYRKLGYEVFKQAYFFEKEL